MRLTAPVVRAISILRAIGRMTPFAFFFLATATTTGTFAQIDTINTKKLLSESKSVEIYFVPIDTMFEQKIDMDKFMSISCKYDVKMNSDESRDLAKIMLENDIRSAIPVEDIKIYSPDRFEPAILLRFENNNQTNDLIFSKIYSNGHAYGKFDGRAIKARYMILNSLSEWALNHPVDNPGNNNFHDCRRQAMRPHG